MSDDDNDDDVSVSCLVEVALFCITASDIYAIGAVDNILEPADQTANVAASCGTVDVMGNTAILHPINVQPPIIAGACPPSRSDIFANIGLPINWIQDIPI